MGRHSGVLWATHSWSPWVGCNKVDTGCLNCYAEREMRERFKLDPLDVHRTTGYTFTGPLRWQREWRALLPADAPVTSFERRPRVFVCPWSDFFHENADEHRAAAWDIMRACPDLNFVILTKRAHRIRAALPPDWGDDGWDNVMLGVSVSEPLGTWRVKQLLSVHAKTYVVSLAPLLARVDLTPYLRPAAGACGYRHLHWVIVEAESGPNARPCPLDFVRELRTLCEQRHTSLFIKQLPGKDGTLDVAPYLDGRQSLQYPTR